MEYKSIGDICDILDNLRKPITGKDREKGPYPYYGANGIQDSISSYIFDGTYLLVGEDGTVLTKDNKPVLHYVSGKFWVNNHAHVLKEKENVSLRYVYHALSMVDIKHLVAGLPPKLNQKNLRSIEIPMPPLKEQETIANKLDKFTEYIALLNEELSLRRKQFEYYKDKLFNFGDDIKRYKLGDIAFVTKLAGFEFTNYVKYSDEGNIIALRGLNVKNGRLILNDVKYIDNSDFSKIGRSKLYINDILYTYVGTVGEVAIIDENDKYYLAPNVSLIRINKENILSKYVMYYLLSNIFKDKDLNKLISVSSMKNLTMEKIREFNIPIPPLEKQIEIVNILDKFEMLCNDTLPKEIALREKQYEYYRDKLLSFS